MINSPQPLPAILQGIVDTPRGPTAPLDHRLPGAAPAHVPSYQVGGAVGPGGVPLRPAGLQAAAPQGPMDSSVVTAQVRQFAAQNPQVVAEIRAAVEQAVLSGEITQQELSMFGQMAATVLQNPSMYPQMRRFAIQQGVAMPEDLPEQYDQGLVVAVLLAVQALQAGVGGQDISGGAPVQSLKDGGRVQGQESKPVIVEAHTGEYVIPKHVVDMKGREFFDRMLEQYKDHATT